MQLCRAASDAIEFLDGQLQRAILLRAVTEEGSEPADGKDRLHGSFAEGILVPDNHRAPVILQSRRKNFTRGRALSAG